MPTREWPTPEWLAEAEQWLVELVDDAILAGGALEYLDINSSAGRFRLQQKSTRLTDPGLIDPTIQIPAARFGTNTSGYFDVGEWLALLDGDQSAVRGEAQMVVFDRRGEIEQAQRAGALAELRRRRDEWVTAEGVRAIHDDVPQWASTVMRPGWMADLDEALLENGFDSGWTVLARADDPIGLVRQRGPLRVQLTVLDGFPLVQFAVWPHCSWMPFSVVAQWIGLVEDEPAMFGAVAVIELGAKFSDMVFDVHRIPNWSHISRIAHEERIRPLGLGVGPVKGADYFIISNDSEVTNLSVQSWFASGEDAYPFRDFEKDPGRVGGGPFVEQALKKGRRVSRLPPILNGWISYIVNAELRPVVEGFAPDALFFEFSIEGVAFFDVRLPKASTASVYDFVRSAPGVSDGVAHRSAVVDPRQMGRPGHIVRDGLNWVFDHRFKDAAGPMLGKSMFRPTWDAEWIAEYEAKRESWRSNQ